MSATYQGRSLLACRQANHAVHPIPVMAASHTGCSQVCRPCMYESLTNLVICPVTDILKMRRHVYYARFLMVTADDSAQPAKAEPGQPEAQPMDSSWSRLQARRGCSTLSHHWVQLADALCSPGGNSSLYIHSKPSTSRPSMGREVPKSIAVLAGQASADPSRAKDPIGGSSFTSVPCAVGKSSGFTSYNDGRLPSVASHWRYATYPVYWARPAQPDSQTARQPVSDRLTPCQAVTASSRKVLGPSRLHSRAQSACLAVPGIGSVLYHTISSVSHYSEHSRCLLVPLTLDISQTVSFMLAYHLLGSRTARTT